MKAILQGQKVSDPVFVITLTNSSGTYNIDKTYSEIWSAYQSGRKIELQYTNTHDNHYLFELSSVIDETTGGMANSAYGLYFISVYTKAPFSIKVQINIGLALPGGDPVESGSINVSEDVLLGTSDADNRYLPRTGNVSIDGTLQVGTQDNPGSIAIGFPSAGTYPAITQLISMECTDMFSPAEGGIITSGTAAFAFDAPIEVTSNISGISLKCAGGTINNVGDPIYGSDAANKNYVDEKTPSYRTVTLTISGWSSNTQTVTVSGVLADETAQLIMPIPALASQSAYYEAGILCTNQAANSLTFTCQKAPSSDLTVYVVIQEVIA